MPWARTAAIAAVVTIAVVAALAEWLPDDDGPGYTPLPPGGGGAIAPLEPVGPNAGPGGAASPLNVALQWRDDALAFNGRVLWDGASPTAAIDAAVTDFATGQPLNQGRFTAGVLRDAPDRIVFATVVPVPGDSRTAGEHSHAVHLVFERPGADGAWTFVRNCTEPNRPDRCWAAGPEWVRKDPARRAAE